MNTKTTLLALAFTAVAQFASAQTYVFNGDIGFEGTATVNNQLTTPTRGTIEVGFNRDFFGSGGDYGVQFHFGSTDVFFYNPDSSTATYSTVWSAGNTVFTFSLTGSGDYYLGTFDDGIGDIVIGSGTYSLSFTTTNQYAATNPGEWSGSPSQLEYSPASGSPFEFNPFVNLTGTFSATITQGSNTTEFDFDLGYAAGAGRYTPTYSTPLGGAVPEPSTYGMIGAAVLAALIAVRRFRARR